MLAVWVTGSARATRSQPTMHLVATFNSTGHREHLFDGAYPHFFGWLFQSGQVLGGELYKGGGARKL